MPKTALALVVVASLGLVVGCSRSDTGYDFDAICATATAPAETPADLVRIRDAIIASAPKTPGDKPEGDDFTRLKAGIDLGTIAGSVAAPYSIPTRLRPPDTPDKPDVASVRKAQKDLAEACD